MSTNESGTCILCNKPAERRTCPNDLCEYECERCGAFYITRSDEADYHEHKPHKDQYPAFKLSALTREQFIAGLPPIFLQLNERAHPPVPNTRVARLGQLIEDGWPKTVQGRLDRALLNLATLSSEAGHIFVQLHLDHPLLFASSDREASYTERCLLDDFLTKSADGCTITPQGWRRISELRSQGPSSDNPVFVAMWFGGKKNTAEMDALYDNAIRPAVQGAGYKVTRVDRAPHNEYVMNKILGDIRLAPFVVADFTGNTHGVYYEAGFARGRDIPVICTCHEDHFKDVHFDMRQLNFILYKTNEQLCERLREHIRGSLGEGPHRLDPANAAAVTCA